TWLNVLNPLNMYLPGRTSTLGGGAALASVTDLIIDPASTSRVLIGLGNIGQVPSTANAGVFRSSDGGNTWDLIVGGNNPSIPNNTLPTGTTVGRVTLALGAGRVGDEPNVYVLMAQPPNPPTPGFIGQGRMLGLFKSKDNLLNFTKVMLRQNIFDPPLTQ